MPRTASTSNAVAPGFITTPMTDIYNKDIKDMLAAQTPDGSGAPHSKSRTRFCSSVKFS